MSWMARGSTDGHEVVSPDSVPKGTIVEVGESTVGVDSSSRIPKRRTLEMAARIGHQPMRVLGRILGRLATTLTLGSAQ